MKLQRIEIANFRLLRNVSLTLEDRVTVIVGRNHRGKTALKELCRRLLGDFVMNRPLDISVMLWIVVSLTAILPVRADENRAPITIDRFEGKDFAGWEISGDAFGRGPVVGAELLRQLDIENVADL